MKLSIAQSDLARGLGNVARAVTGRILLPVLSNVLLRAADGHLTLAATDLEIAVETIVPARIEEEGALTVPFRTFMDLVKALPDEPVSLEQNEEAVSLHLECGKTKANVKGIMAEEFPQLPAIDEEWPYVELPAAAFRQAVNGVAFAVATDSTRPTLTGVNLTLEEGCVEMAATDGFRLSRRSFEMDTGYRGKGHSTIIPGRALQEVVRLLPEKADTVTLIFPAGREQAIFQMEQTTLHSQTINGNYPDVSVVVPKAWRTQAVIETARLMHAAKLANVFAREVNHTARLSIGDGAVTIAAQSAETGSNEIVLEATVEGPPLVLGVNVAYLMDAIGVTVAPQVYVQGNSANEPVVFRAEGSDWLHLVMPMQTGR